MELIHDITTGSTEYAQMSFQRMCSCVQKTSELNIHFSKFKLDMAS